MALPTLQQTSEDKFGSASQRRQCLRSMTSHWHPADVKRLWGTIGGNRNVAHSKSNMVDWANVEEVPATPSGESEAESQRSTDSPTPHSVDSLERTPFSINEAIKANRATMEKRGKAWLRDGPFQLPEADLQQIIGASFSALYERVLQWAQGLPASDQSKLTADFVSEMVWTFLSKELNKRYVECCVVKGLFDRSARYHFRGLQSADADDLSQESLLKIRQHGENIRPRGVLSYMREILRTVLQNLHRKRAKMAHPSSEVDAVARDDTGNQQKAKGISDAIEQAIQEMPPDQRPMIRVWLEALEGDSNDADAEE